MEQYIADCLKPSYELQWLKTIPFDSALIQDMIIYVAFTDKRLF